MGFSGPRYTWSNKRELNNLILERIDRFFMNLDWCLLFPDAKARIFLDVTQTIARSLWSLFPIGPFILLDRLNSKNSGSLISPFLVWCLGPRMEAEIW